MSVACIAHISRWHHPAPSEVASSVDTCAHDDHGSMSCISALRPSLPEGLIRFLCEPSNWHRHLIANFLAQVVKSAVRVVSTRTVFSGPWFPPFPGLLHVRGMCHCRLLQAQRAQRGERVSSGQHGRRSFRCTACQRIPAGRQH